MAARDRSAFETFWIAKGAPPGSKREIESHARERKRDLRSQMGFPQSGFLPADAPIGAKTLFNQKRDLKRLAEIATAEGSAIAEGAWPDLVDLRNSRGENEGALLDAGGKLPVEERRRRRLTAEEGDEIARQSAIEHIVDHCERLDDAGADGADVLEAMVQDEAVPAVDGVDVDAIADDLADIEAEFGTDLVVDAIAECRDQLAGPGGLTPGEEVEVGDVIDRLRERFDLPRALTLEEALSALEERAEAEPEPEVEEAALNRLSRAFGQRFDSVDEAIRRLQERLEQARGERLRIAPVEIRESAGDLLVRVEDGEAFQPFRDPARERIQRELDLSDLPPTWTTVGEIRLRGEDLEAIDLEIGRERLGTVAEPQPLDIERGPEAGEQADLEQATAIDNLRRLVDQGRQEGL